MLSLQSYRASELLLPLRQLSPIFLVFWQPVHTQTLNRPSYVQREFLSHEGCRNNVAYLLHLSLLVGRNHYPLQQQRERGPRPIYFPKKITTSPESGTLLLAWLV